jgi:hypothetical protein
LRLSSNALSWCANGFVLNFIPYPNISFRNSSGTSSVEYLVLHLKHFLLLRFVENPIAITFLLSITKMFDELQDGQLVHSVIKSSVTFISFCFKFHLCHPSRTDWGNSWFNLLG